MKTALILGAGGFIGSHMAKALKADGYFVRGVDLKHPEFGTSAADEFVIGDLREQDVCRAVLDRPFDEVWQFAADMGGAGYIFTGEHDADIMHNSAQINLTVAQLAAQQKVGKLFYSSSACMYPAHNQLDPDNPNCREDSAYPAAPDSEYGWEKLFSERLYMAYARNHGLQARIARYHNIFGPEGTWTGGKEKAPAAMCRKAAATPDGGTMEVWGPGTQTRSFLYIDVCIEASRRLMASGCTQPVNIGSEEMVSINQLAQMAIAAAGKRISIANVPGPLGVNGRNSDNALYRELVGWDPASHPFYKLETGLGKTYQWIAGQLAGGAEQAA